MNFDKELSLAIRASKEAGNYFRNLSEIKILSNEGKDIKLKADEEAEQIILRHLSESKYPIISEETRAREKSLNDLEWIVDPLDGSLNFSRGIPNCVVSIALWKGLEPILGVIYDFNREELYSGIVGKGAHLNGKRTSVSNIREKKDALICTGIAKKADYSDENLSDIVRKIQDFKKIRFLGSAALSLAYIASGKADVYSEDRILLWDVAAGLALVKAAAGEINFEKIQGNEFDVFASNGKIGPE